jgi:hypothetical protein
MTEPDSDALRIEEKLDRIAGEVAVSGDQIVGHLGRIEDLLLVLNDTMLRL